jgi:NADH:quinone reductase (non-electrogenic)
MFKTKVTEMLGIQYPILAGPMAYLSTPEFVAAVSNAGGLGIMPSTTYKSIDDIKNDIRKIKSLTKKPFAINVTLMPTARPVKYEDCVQAAIDEGVKIIETSGRSPEPYMPMLKAAKAITIHRATRTRDIKTAERVGANMVAIVGNEGAGHPGQEEVGSMVRIPMAVGAVKVPVIAAGGIADARGFVAALALGAEGVLMGTRFMASKECPVPDNIKQWLMNLNEADTVLIQKTIKNAERVVRTVHSEKILDMESKGATLEDLLPLISGARGAMAYATGDYNSASITVGQVVGMIQDVPTVQDIIDNIIKEAPMVMKRLKMLEVG